MQDEIERIRLGISDPRSAISTTPRITKILGKVVTPGVTIGLNKFVTMQPVHIVGDETEGATSTLENAGETMIAMWLGPKTPTVGDMAVVSRVDYRWITGRQNQGGGSGPPIGGGIPGCLCTAIPLTLTMTPGGFCGNVFDACTLQWGPTPPELAELPLGTECFLSNESFYHNLFESYYRWHLFCYAALFGVKRAFLPTTQGGPFLDATFFAWTIGLPGNHCTPFLLSNGRIFPGGDPRCVLTIAEAVP